MAVEFVKTAWTLYTAARTLEEVAPVVEEALQEHGPQDDGRLPLRTLQLLAQEATLSPQRSAYENVQVPTTPTPGAPSAR